MLAPSRSRAPLAFVALARSEPARSIRLILAMQTLWLRLAVLSCCLKYIWENSMKQSIVWSFLGVVHLIDITNHPSATDFFTFVQCYLRFSPVFSAWDLKYLKYSVRPGRGGIHVSRVLCPVAIARIQSFKNMLCGLRLERKNKRRCMTQ